MSWNPAIELGCPDEVGTELSTISDPSSALTWENHADMPVYLPLPGLALQRHKMQKRPQDWHLHGSFCAALCGSIR